MQCARVPFAMWTAAVRRHVTATCFVLRAYWLRTQRTGSRSSSSRSCWCDRAVGNVIGSSTASSPSTSSRERAQTNGTQRTGSVNVPVGLHAFTTGVLGLDAVLDPITFATARSHQQERELEYATQFVASVANKHELRSRLTLDLVVFVIVHRRSRDAVLDPAMFPRCSARASGG